MAPAEPGLLHGVLDGLSKELYKKENGLMVRILGKAEQTSGQSREKIAAVSLGLFSVYLVFGFYARLVCNFISMAYPSYASLVAMKSSAKDESRKWLIYWIIFALFSLMDFGSKWINSKIPIYWVGKVFILGWLWWHKKGPEPDDGEYETLGNLRTNLILPHDAAPKKKKMAHPHKEEYKTMFGVDGTSLLPMDKDPPKLSPSPKAN